MNYSKGQGTLSVIMWAGGLAFTMALASYGYTSASIGKVSDTVIVDGQRISTLEEAVMTIKSNQVTQTADIKEILKLLK